MAHFKLSYHNSMPNPKDKVTYQGINVGVEMPEYAWPLCSSLWLCYWAYCITPIWFVELKMSSLWWEELVAFATVQNILFPLWALMHSPPGWTHWQFPGLLLGYLHFNPWLFSPVFFMEVRLAQMFLVAPSYLLRAWIAMIHGMQEAQPWPLPNTSLVGQKLASRLS